MITKTIVDKWVTIEKEVQNLHSIMNSILETFRNNKNSVTIPLTDSKIQTVTVNFVKVEDIPHYEYAVNNGNLEVTLEFNDNTTEEMLENDMITIWVDEVSPKDYHAPSIILSDGLLPKDIDVWEAMRKHPDNYEINVLQKVFELYHVDELSDYYHNKREKFTNDLKEQIKSGKTIDELEKYVMETDYYNSVFYDLSTFTSHFKDMSDEALTTRIYNPLVADGIEMSFDYLKLIIQQSFNYIENRLFDIIWDTYTLNAD